nr:MAG TPA: hypothetical protein [Inoviridae sp.]
MMFYRVDISKSCIENANDFEMSCVKQFRKLK